MTASTQGVSTPAITKAMRMKVPEITLAFWIAKLATTAFGETFSDYIFFNDYMLTFALGTAAGDYVAGPLTMGTLDSTFIFLGIVILPFIGYRWLHVNVVCAFWFAYTITRPLGASFGDWLGVPAPCGDGLPLGTGPMSLATGLVLLAVVSFIVVRHQRDGARTGRAAGPLT